MTLVEVYNSGNLQLTEILSEGASSFGALVNFKKQVMFIFMHPFIF